MSSVQFRNGGRLSQAYQGRQDEHRLWARCDDCQVIYVDDQPCCGQIACPGCGSPLYRGIQDCHAKRLIGVC